MDIGICLDGFYDFTLEHSPQTLNKLQKIGFAAIDYPIYGPWNFPNPIFENSKDFWQNYFLEERKIIEEQGLKVYQTHATFRSDFDQDNFGTFSQKVIDQLKREIEATAILGAKYVVIHPMKDMGIKNKDVYFQRNVEGFDKLTPFLKEFEVTCALENLFEFDSLRATFDDTWCQCPDDLIKYIDALDQTCFCACLDTGHSNLVGGSPAFDARKLGKRLKVLHVNDNFSKKDLHLPVGIGYIDWNDFALALKEIDYDGAFNLELSLNRYKKINNDAFWKMVEFSYISAKEVVDKIK